MYCGELDYMGHDPSRLPIRFVWAPRDAVSRDAAYAAALAAFVAREGHDRVPKRHRELGLGLGEWVYRRRRQSVAAGE